MNPTKTEWDLCNQYAHQLAQAYCDDAVDSKIHAVQIRKKFLNYLHRLREKYPESVNVSASLGDVYVNYRFAMKYLEMAYKMAEKDQDFFNLTQIADSFVTRLLNKEPINYDLASYWVKVLADNLQKSYDEDIDKNLKEALLVLQRVV